MSNFLDNGAVLPNGLLGEDTNAMMSGFNKSYKNTALRVGVIVETFPVSDTNNKSKLTTEYNVVVTEQHEDKGSTTILYRNCMSSEGFGSIADFFERTLRKTKKRTKKGDAVNTKGQDGAIALILCLDGVSDKAVVIGQLTHPDRQTTLKTAEPRLEGEYNGINVKIETDGSAKFTFRGATDNQGKPIDSSQGDTVLEVTKDGSFHFNHKTIDLMVAKVGDVILDVKGNGNITINAAKDITINNKGNTTLNTTKDVNVNCTNATVTAKATATVEGKLVKLGAGAAEAVIKGDTFAGIFDSHIHPTGVGPSGPPTKPMKPSLSKKVKTE